MDKTSLRSLQSDELCSAHIPKSTPPQFVGCSSRLEDQLAGLIERRDTVFSAMIRLLAFRHRLDPEKLSDVDWTLLAGALDHQLGDDDAEREIRACPRDKLVPLGALMRHYFELIDEIEDVLRAFERRVSWLGLREEDETRDARWWEVRDA
jgi:hypothetical protein